MVMADRNPRMKYDRDEITTSATRSRLSRIKLSSILRDMMDIRDRWDADNVIESIYLSRDHKDRDRRPPPQGRT